jgi:nitrite reductase/ring-hydroxylating ferredoxin subunit
MAYIPLAKLHQLYDGYRQALRFNGRDLLLLQEQGRTYLILNQCPHRGAPLTHATLAGDCLRCPLHGIEFNLHTGKAANTADCSERLVFLPIIYEANTLGIEVADG